MPIRIMVVDDEQPILSLIESAIRGPEIDVIPLSNSLEAADLLKVEKLDGVFVDVRMPRLDGFELTKLVRRSRLNGSIPVVLMTGSNDVDTMQEGFQAGATCFLGKPFESRELSALARAMQSPKSSERRKHRRLPYSPTVSCSVDRDEESEFITTGLNIGPGGMLLRPSNGLVVGQQLRMRFVLPDGTEIRDATALVVREGPGGCVAIVFMSANLEALQTLASK